MTPQDVNQICDKLPPLVKMITIIPVPPFQMPLAYEIVVRALLQISAGNLSTLKLSALDVLGDVLGDLPKPKVVGGTRGKLSDIGKEKAAFECSCR